MILIDVGGKILASPAYVGVVVFEEWDSGSFSAYICWLVSIFKLYWINSEERIFLMYMMNRYSDMLEPACEVVLF